MQRVGLRIAALGCAFALLSSGFSQVGWSRYRVWVANEKAAARINECSLGLFSDEIAFETDVIVGPGEFKKLIQLKLPYKKIQDLPDPRNWFLNNPIDYGDYRNSYFNLTDLYAFYDDLVLLYPHIVSRYQIGVSRENRPVFAYRIFHQVQAERYQAPNNVIFQFGIHAREWISPAVGMHITKTLAETLNGGFTPFTSKLIDRMAVWVVPTLNPDGYTFTWTNNRLWRKNRRFNGTINGQPSYGVDLNRNYSKGWGGSGSSGNANSDTYRGPSAFSEPELQGLRTLSESLPNVRGFIDFHSYSQLLLWPWSYTTALHPQNAWLETVGNGMKATMIAEGGLSYTTGPGGSTLYIASGASNDWFIDRFSTTNYTVPSYVIELRDTGTNGFLLPESQITPTQNEAWSAARALLDAVAP